MPPLCNSSMVSAIATTSQRPSTVATIDPLSGVSYSFPSLLSLEGQWLFHAAAGSIDLEFAGLAIPALTLLEVKNVAEVIDYRL